MAMLFVERLTIVDFSFLDQRRGLVGESWILDLELEGDLDSQGMVFDFSLVKKSVKKWIDEHIDHKLLVPGASSAYYQDTSDGIPTLTFRLDSGEHVKHIGPTTAIKVLNGVSMITPEAVAEFIEIELKKTLPSNIDKITLNLKVEPIDGSFYQYSHGLAKHQGNCQRIAHGHRSRIKIYLENERSPEWEQIWSQRFRDSYIGSEDHVVPCANENYTLFKYQAEQGTFSLEINSDRCYLIPTESTVEQIAQHIATETAKETHSRVKVYAFEGVGKGSMATARKQN